MDGFTTIAGLVLVLLIGAFGAVIVNSTPATGSPHTTDEALEIAARFMTADPTYRFDGMEDTLKIGVNGSPAAYTYEIVAEFTSSQGGYGDRKDVMTTQVLTPHRAVLTVEKGVVTAAVMDEYWNMLTGQAIGPDAMPKYNPQPGDVDGSLPPV